MSMKIVLLILSGDPLAAREILKSRFHTSEVETLTRAEVANSTYSERLRGLRARAPEIFAVATERLVWQRGQNALLLLGALAGAGTTIIFDRHGAWREESRASALMKAPARLVREAAISAAALVRSRRQLTQLEAAIQTRSNRTIDSGTGTSDGHPNITYIRASPGPGTQAGGAASHMNGFVNAATKLGAYLSLISNDEIAGLDQEKVPLKIIWPRPVGSTRAAFDIYNNLLFTQRAIAEIEGRPDFIYQRYSRFSFAGVAASLKLRRPLFLEYNGSEVWVGRYWDHVGSLNVLARYERLNLKAAAYIFVVSEVVRQDLLRAGVDDDKIVVNPNGVDVERFRPGIGGERVRQEFGIAPDETLVGFVGTFGPWHGVETLATAITLIPQNEPVRFLLIGSGALSATVEEILRAGGAEQRAIIAGSVPHERVATLLDACDVLVSPHIPLQDGSEFFGSPTKLFEYMAMGKAIIASRLGQIAEALTDETSALLVEPGNVQHLTQALLRLGKSPDLRQRLGAAARIEAIRNYTWTHNAERVLRAYDEWRQRGC